MTIAIDSDTVSRLETGYENIEGLTLGSEYQREFDFAA